MKKRPIVLAFACFSLVADAQVSTLGFKLGISVTELSAPIPLGTTYEPLLSFAGGLAYTRKWTSPFVIELNAMYNRFGVIQYFTMVDIAGNPNTYPITIRYEYFSFPILAGVQGGKNLFGGIKLGLVPSILYTGTMTESLSTGRMQTTGISDRESIIDMPVMAEVEGGIQIDKSNRISGIIAYRHGLLPLRGLSWPNETATHRGLFFMIGLTHILPQKAKKVEAETSK